MNAENWRNSREGRDASTSTLSRKYQEFPAMLIYYVYAYLREDGTPYYIGKGTHRRAWAKKHGKIGVPKDERRIIICERNLTEIGAFALERRLIRWYGKKCDCTGILHNRLDGGDGASGLKHSEESKRKIGEASKDRKHTEETKRKLSEMKIGNSWNSGRKASTETRQKLSKASIGNTNWAGKKHSEETKLKISQSKRGKMFSEEHKQKLSIAAKNRCRKAKSQDA